MQRLYEINKMITPAKQNLKIYIGRDHEFPFNFWQDEVGGVAVDLSGSTITAECRVSMAQDSELIFIFDVWSDLPNGQTKLLVSRAVTDILTARKGYYDYVLTDSLGKAHTYFYGRVDFVKMPTDM